MIIRQQTLSIKTEILRSQKIVLVVNEQPLCRNTDDINVTSVSEGFSNKYKFGRRGVHIANISIRHLKQKLDHVKIMLHESDIDNFCVCETFLNKTINDETIKINGFTHERKYRDGCTDEIK